MKYVQKRVAIALLSAMLLTVGVLATSTAASAAEYAVVVNAKNDYSAPKEEMKQTVRRIFLKQQSDWPNGTEGAPFARGDMPAQGAFNEAILGMSDVAYSDYWIKMKQTEGSVAPRTVGSTSILVRQIGRHDGGFSVVPVSTDLPADVRTLFTFSR